MGGRGSPSRLTGTGTGTVAKTPKRDTVTSLTSINGTQIDLTGIPLEYGEKDPVVTDTRRAAVEAWELKRYKSKVEYGWLGDEDGNFLVEKRGGKGSVSLPTYIENQATIMSHVHPRASGWDDGCIGGTFSYADLESFARFVEQDPSYRKFAGTVYEKRYATGKMTTYRATAVEGTYSISKTPKLDKDGLLKYYKREDSKLLKANKDATKQLTADYNSGKIDYDEYIKRWTKESNRYLVGLHNALLAGQSTYGYTYTLEKR